MTDGDEKSKSTVFDAIKAIIAGQENDDPFYVMNVDNLREQAGRWLSSLPSVKPYYAVKCNPDPMIYKIMSQEFKFGFDCASINEIRAVLESGVPSKDIVYCNPCRQPSHLQDAYRLGLRIFSFDSHDELIKIVKHCPECQLILRIWVDDTEAVCRLGSKYGANQQQTAELLHEAKSLGLNVVGVSFHVGSNCGSPKAYARAINDAKRALDVASSLGFNMTILDIGGGYQAGGRFEDTAVSINEGLGLVRQSYPEINVIAEPGRFFAETPFTLTTRIIAHKVVDGIQMYYINEGVYGSFNCLIYDHATTSATPLDQDKLLEPTFLSRIWGPTCDSFDCVIQECRLPLLQTGDCLVFQRMGAYTIAGRSTFNGFESPKIYYINI